MSAEFEIWGFHDSSAMWGLPNHRRMHEISREPALLLLRFSATDWEAALRVRERFLHEGNPDQIVPLNIPAKHFFTASYRCGVQTGDRLRPKEDYALIHGDWAVGYFPKGTVLEVLPGDKEYPEWIFVKVLSFPGTKQQKINRFEVHERDIEAGLFIHQRNSA